MVSGKTKLRIHCTWVLFWEQPEEGARVAPVLYRGEEIVCAVFFVPSTCKSLAAENVHYRLFYFNICQLTQNKSSFEFSPPMSFGCKSSKQMGNEHIIFRPHTVLINEMAVYSL